MVGSGARPDAAPPLPPRRVPHVRGAPGAKSLVDDLILGRGFVRSRAAPSLRSIESQPSTQAFVALFALFFFAAASPRPAPARAGPGRRGGGAGGGKGERGAVAARGRAPAPPSVRPFVRSPVGRPGGGDDDAPVSFLSRFARGPRGPRGGPGVKGRGGRKGSRGPASPRRAAREGSLSRLPSPLSSLSGVTGPLGRAPPSPRPNSAARGRPGDLCGAGGTRRRALDTAAPSPPSLGARHGGAGRYTGRPRRTEARVRVFDGGCARSFFRAPATPGGPRRSEARARVRVPRVDESEGGARLRPWLSRGEPPAGLARSPTGRGASPHHLDGTLDPAARGLGGGGARPVRFTRMTHIELAAVELPNSGCLRTSP